VKYMCKVFLGDIAFVCSGLGDLEGAEGVDKILGKAEGGQFLRQRRIHPFRKVQCEKWSTRWAEMQIPGAEARCMGKR